MGQHGSWSPSAVPFFRRFYHNIGVEHIGQIKLKFYCLPLLATSRPRGGGWIPTGEKVGWGAWLPRSSCRHSTRRPCPRVRLPVHSLMSAGLRVEGGVWPVLPPWASVVWVRTGHVVGLQPLQVGEQECGPQKRPNDNASHSQCPAVKMPLASRSSACSLQRRGSRPLPWAKGTPELGSGGPQVCSACLGSAGHP